LTSAGQVGQGSGTSAASATSTLDTPPVIQINGNNPATITVGDTYADLGATITGPQADLNLGIHVSVDGGATTTLDQISIDTSTSSTHTVLYFATDQNGLTTSATRTVTVQAAATTTP
jgi:phage-related protein